MVQGVPLLLRLEPEKQTLANGEVGKDPPFLGHKTDPACKSGKGFKL
jgi:hypothetical protein